MKETESTTVNAPENEQPIQFAYKPDAKITVVFEGWQFNQFQQALKPFEGPLAKINDIHNKMIMDGISKPVYYKDLDETGNLRKDFFNEPVKESKPLIEVVSQ